jgi:hypothetical protein
MNSVWGPAGSLPGLHVWLLKPCFYLTYTHSIPFNRSIAAISIVPEVGKRVSVSLG